MLDHSIISVFLVKQVPPTSPDTKLVDEELYANPNLKESILNIMADRPESSTRTVAHQVGVNHQIVCEVVNEYCLYPFHFH